MPKPEHRPEGDLERESIQSIFHRCWTHAVVSPEYDKSEWKELCARLKERGLPMQC